MIYGIVITVVVLLFLWGLSIKKNMKDPDVLEASKLRMNILRFKKYKEIYEEQMEYARRGEIPPNRISEIPNMNEWRRYCQEQDRKSHEDFMKSLDELRNSGK